jgi:3'(2'), 5'-bisphosphate nucleotidase
MLFQDLIYLAIQAAFKGGEEILSIYKTDFLVETKSDNTPVTAADKASGKAIAEVLHQSTYPVISEEELVPPYAERKDYQHVWIVDPLDGTKEYVKRNGEFAVNVALTENKQPVIGVIYAPILKTLYFAGKDFGSYKITEEVLYRLHELSITELCQLAIKLPAERLPANYTVIASRSHLSREVNEHIERLSHIYGKVAVINVGSSIKQCWVAEGKAHEYPRYGLTMEWDTAAGQCILEEAGSQLIDLQTGNPMVYNKEDLRNNYFVARHGSSM